MYKIMIADDEQIVLEGIKFIIEENFSKVNIVATASSGREAIESTNHVIPDIVLMDIKMPGINGIEAIETIKKRYPSVRFIIISAYEQFEYAKQAVELGVSDYILKPINQEKLLKVLRKIMDDIDEERKQRAVEIENREKLEKIIPVLEHGFIYSMLLNVDYREELFRYEELFTIDQDFGYVMIFEFGEKDSDDKLGNRIGAGVKGQTFYPKVQNEIKYKCKSIVGPLVINRMIVIVLEEETDNEYKQRIKAIQLTESIIESIRNYVDSHICVGIGSCYRLDKIKNSLEEANQALTRNTSEEIIHVNDVFGLENEEKEYTYVDIKEDETYIVQLMENGNEELVAKEIQSFMSKIQTKFHGELEDVMSIAMELMVMVLSTSYKNNLNEGKVGYSTYLTEIRRMDTFSELVNWCIGKVQYVTRLLQDTRIQHVSDIVMSAKKYIDQHYNEEIGLNDISKEVAVSPQYFSKIFKEEIGLTFVEYLRSKRIDVAKEMLKSKKYSVKEICYEIGYNDPNYFSRLFKKLVGVTPTDYK